MRATVEKLAEQAIHLSKDQRLSLAYRILSTIEPPLTAQIEEAWDREIRNRIEKFKQGLSKSVSSEEVFADLDTALKK